MDLCIQSSLPPLFFLLKELLSTWMVSKIGNLNSEGNWETLEDLTRGVKC